jgi:predicted secreted protein with PEFG-CTERM motif
MRLPALLVVFALSSMLANAYAQEPMVMEQVTPNGKVKVELTWPEVLPDQLYDIELLFLDPESNKPITGFIKYNLAVTQNEDFIEHYTDQITEDGGALFEVVFPEGGTGPAQVIVSITAMNSEAIANLNDMAVVFNVQVVPEFATMTVMIMAISIAAVLALSRFKTSRRFYRSTVSC